MEIYRHCLVDKPKKMEYQKIIKVADDSPGTLSYEKTTEIFRLTKDFFSNPDLAVPYIEKEAKNIASFLEATLGENHAVTFGLGYPFYAIDREGKPLLVEEPKKYIDEKISDFENKRNKDTHRYWVCPACQTENNLTELKSVCDSCNLVSIKPRDVFRILPDIDLLTVVNTLDVKTEEKIKDALKKNGYNYSNISIKNTLGDAKEIMASLQIGSTSEKKLPIDMHLIDKESFLNALTLIQSGGINPPSKIRSLHSEWENDILWNQFDFIFSATPLTGVRGEKIKAEILKTQVAIKETIGADSMIDQIKKLVPRAARILESKPIENNLRNKINGWGSSDSKK